MNKKIITFVFAVAFFMLTSCATIVRGSKENFVISSHPQGAKVEVLDKNNTAVASFTTPTNIALKKGAEFFSGQTYTVKVSKEGYKPSSFRIENNLNVGAYIIGNIFLGGFLGILVVDPASGAMWNLEASNVTLDNGSVQKGADNNVFVGLEKQ